MTTNEKVARRKLSLLELAKELNNVSKACKLIGYSRQQFYEIRRNYQTYGAEGLLDKLPGCKGAHPNRVAPEIEQAILDSALTRPTHGPLRVAQELALQGINVSAGGVRGVWQRHDLLSKHDRLLRLEKTHREQVIELNDEQIRLLERFSPEFRERQIEVHYTGGTGSGRHLLRRRAQGGRQGVSANRAGLLQSPRLGTALHQQASGDLGSCAQRNGAAVL